MRAAALVAVAVFAAGCADSAVTTTAMPTAPSPSPAPAASVTTAAPPPPVTSSIAATEEPARTTSTSAPAASTTLASPPLRGLALEIVADGLRQPVFAAALPDTDSIVVVQRAGTMVTVASDGTVTPYLDLTDRVGSSGIEQGLLGLAFHPEYPSDRRIFVSYTDLAGRSTVSALAGGDEEVLLAVDQPTNRHNAGMIEFGPDGLLYVAIGDGGSGGEHGQDVATLLGQLVTIDVESGDHATWGYGLRNPWRFTIDDSLVYVADVGQEDWEEISVWRLDRTPANFGWPITEGSGCFRRSECDRTDLVAPVVEYPHDEGCSVTGGYVYRGAAIPELDGHYFYSDWCGGWLRSFRYQDGAAGARRDWTDEVGEVGQVNSFGLDADGELLVVTWDGRLMRLVAVR